MSTLEMILAGIAFIAVGLPIYIMFAAAVIVGLPIAAWHAWTFAIGFVVLVSDVAREEWSKRRARKAGA